MHEGMEIMHSQIARLAATIGLGALLVGLTGCWANNRIVGHNIVQAGDWYGELGITGHLNQITIRPPSSLHRLSVIGDANIVHVLPHVTLGKVEVWGQNNKIYIPARLVIRSHVVGAGSEVVRLEPGQTPQMRGEPPMSYERPLIDQESMPQAGRPAPAGEPDAYRPAPADAPESIEPPPAYQPPYHPEAGGRDAGARPTGGAARGGVQVEDVRGRGE